MLSTLGIVDACYESPRARAKAARKLGGKSVLEWVVRRATDCQRLDGVIVVTCCAEENQFLSELVPLDVPLFTAQHDESLPCFLAALEQFPAQSAVRICARSPFIDPALIDRLVREAESEQDCDYVSYRSRDGRPAVLSPVGVFAEWFRVSALRRASRKVCWILPSPPSRQMLEHGSQIRVSQSEGRPISPRLTCATRGSRLRLP